MFVTSVKLLMLLKVVLWACHKMLCEFYSGHFLVTGIISFFYTHWLSITNTLVQNVT